MSDWTYVRGYVEVHGFGRTQHEIEYVLKTVLDHLPIVSGSEGDMNTYLIKSREYSGSSSHDEFFQRTENAVTRFGERSRRHGMYPIQDIYFIFLEGNLRDRIVPETVKELTRWLFRLAKRTIISGIDVTVSGCGGKTFRFNNANPFYGAFEDVTWDPEHPGNWIEYLLWQRANPEDGDYYPEVLRNYYRQNESNGGS